MYCSGVDTFMEVAGGDAFQVNCRDQPFEALRSASVGGKYPSEKRMHSPPSAARLNPVITTATAPMPVMTRARADGHGAPAGGGHHRSACRHGRRRSPQPRPPRHSPTALARRPAKPRSMGRKRPWLRQLDDIILVTAYHSFGGEVEALQHPHDTPPYPSRRHRLPRITHSWVQNLLF